ncbi:uncharacterized protein LOC129168545 isoform X2 [Dunckerocampus dactyliophorus]|nr:uncharacterized protein LOC129168545 isoform X2 [Dunckerocampus dactyliophorus]XP_054609939.1 uncharacterized protein LOC129168545 isoform X2 [Dunckerocampus dactyliophorus]XP_054609940.1 uncharacterized protein LOC129168545 isoform X2 [Dunckerocampus dactyliophorus]
MEDLSSAYPFTNLHPPHASFHLTQPGLQSPEVDSFQQYGSRVTSFPSWKRTGDTHVEGTDAGEHFVDTWYESGNKANKGWESCEDIYGNLDSCCNTNDYGEGEHQTSNTSSHKLRRMYFRDMLHTFKQSSSAENDWDYGSSREDMDQPPWLHSSSVGQSQTLPSSSLSQTSAPQKLDSFSEAFLSRRRTFPQDFHRESCGPSLQSEVVKDTLVLNQKCVSPASSYLRSSVINPTHIPLASTMMDFTSPSPGGEANYGALDFFATRFPSLSSLYSSMMWPLPVVPDRANSMEGNLRASPAGDCRNVTPFSHPESAFRPHSASSHAPHHGEAAESDHFVTNRKHTGSPFPSILRSGKDTRSGHYTPRPLLNPGRRGTGLYSSLPSLHPQEEETVCSDEEMECHVTARVNTGNEFQAALPPQGPRARSPGKQFNSEQLLWQPQRELEESSALQDQVEKLLLMCSSSCLPGGGNNTELALHCLHSCKGNIVATLEMLLQTQASPTGDYHYSGSDFWSEREKSDFNTALNTYGKNFTCIHQMVKTKTVHQCVEFYYHNKKLQDKQRKEQEQEKQEEKSKELRYPCKQCGKTFFKIQSRNAHMKIHRQSQEGLTDKFITRHLSLPCGVNHTHLLEAPPLSFPCADSLLTLNLADISTSEYSYTGSPNSQVSAIADAGGSKQIEAPSSALAFDQSWASFDEFYCVTSKEMVGTQMGETKEPISWL